MTVMGQPFWRGWCPANELYLAKRPLEQAPKNTPVVLQGTQSAEVLAVAQAAGSAQEATAYLNMETGAAWRCSGVAIACCWVLGCSAPQSFDAIMS